MLTTDDLFGGPLLPDPKIELPGAIPVPAWKNGPLPRIEFTIEMVGPYSVPAHAAARILDQDWYVALGHPQAWAMRPSDTKWDVLTGDKNGSYDSLALSWPIARPDGDLKTKAAVLLEKTTHHFAEAVNRRAVCLPRIEDVDYLSMDLRRVLANLDIGLCLTFHPTRRIVSELEIWRTCAALGLQFSPDGSFVYRVRGSELALFEVLPLGPVEKFSLGNVQAGVQHEGVSIGCSIPMCPNPEKAIEGALRTARAFCERIGGKATDDEGRFVDAAVAQSLIEQAQHANKLFEQAQLVPGSPEAVRLFSNNT